MSHSSPTLWPAGESKETLPLTCHSHVPRVVDVSLPRFSITGNYDLKRTLSYLGITKIFEEHGDLTRISPHRSLKVGEVSLPGLDARPSRKEPSHSPGPETLSQQLNESCPTTSQAGPQSSSVPNQPCHPGRITEAPQPSHF